jgi:DNA-binding NtrC family response regulator
MADILVVDDDRSIASAFEQFLEYEGQTCRLASSAEDAFRLIADRRPDLVIMDVRMPGLDGLQALQEIRARFPDVLVVIMTAYGTSQISIDAIRAGAFDYVMKPLDLDELRGVIRKALAARDVRERAEAAGPDEALRQPAVTLVGQTPGMLHVYKMIGRLGTNDVPALVVGERGTGKRLTIATIHDNSARKDQPFVSVDCGQMPAAALEAELFGRSTGTIHLDRIESMPAPLQARLAQTFGVQARGARQRLEARILASTERELSEDVAAGEFSRELYEALSVVVLRLPPLRERREDIPLLVRHFIQRFNGELDRSIRGVDERVARLLQEQPWPGNVGQLERVVKRACIVAQGDVITRDDIGDSLSESRFPSGPDLESSLARATRASLHERLEQHNESRLGSVFHDIVDMVEATLVSEALAMTGGNQVKAADMLGVNRATLRKKMPSV